MNNSHGSHGKTHAKLKGKLECRKLPNGTPVFYKQMRRIAIEAIQNAGAGNGSEKCLRAQLDDYYKLSN